MNVTFPPKVAGARSKVAGATALLALLTGCASASVESLPSPPVVSVPPTSSEIPDFSATRIEPVRGTTTTSPVGIRGGNATVRGQVTIGGAPAGGASVRIERLVGDRAASLDVVANEAGFYEAAGLQGGRYRVRAFRPPDSTQTRAEVFFMAGNENRQLALGLDRFSGGTDVRASISPSPPLIGTPATLTISVTTRGVDASGTARSIGAPNLGLTLITQGGRSVVSSNTSVTDAAGRAQFTVVCNTIDNQGLSLIVSDGSSYGIEVAGCQVPPPTTTTTTQPPGIELPVVPLPVP